MWVVWVGGVLEAFKNLSNHLVRAVHKHLSGKGMINISNICYWARLSIGYYKWVSLRP